MKTKLYKVVILDNKYAPEKILEDNLSHDTAQEMCSDFRYANPLVYYEVRESEASGVKAMIYETKKYQTVGKTNHYIKTIRAKGYDTVNITQVKKGDFDHQHDEVLSTFAMTKDEAKKFAKEILEICGE